MTDPTDTPPVDLTSAPADDGRVEALEAQVHDYKLLVADLQTSARRLNDDAAKQRKYASEGFARDVLGLLDNLERSAEAAKTKGESGVLLDGVTATMTAAMAMLKRHAVEKIEVGPGTPFDPNLHMAVSQQPTADHPPGSVLSVLQQGFTFHDRVLRPAAVIVASDS